MSDNKNLYALRKGAVLAGQYRIEETLGAGGFGITYRAMDTKLARVVAVKEFYPGSWVTRNVEVSSAVTPVSNSHGLLFAAMKEKFIGEARVMAQLDTANYVVRVYNFFEENRTAYIVMEFLDGVTLKQHIAQHGPMRPDELCRLTIPLLHSLYVIHNAQLIHRDIAPDNIMLLRNPIGSPILKLMDFGAARSFSEQERRSKSVILKPGFAPIEQYQPHSAQGAWTDLYALSATMYYGMTGVIPPAATVRITNDTLRRPSEMNVPIRPAMEETILKGMNNLPENRYQTAKEMALALESALYGHISSENASSAIPQSTARPKPMRPADSAGIRTVLIPEEEIPVSAVLTPAPVRMNTALISEAQPPAAPKAEAEQPAPQEQKAQPVQPVQQKQPVPQEQPIQQAQSTRQKQPVRQEKPAQITNPEQKPTRKFKPVRFEQLLAPFAALKAVFAKRPKKTAPLPNPMTDWPEPSPENPKSAKDAASKPAKPPRKKDASHPKPSVKEKHPRETPLKTASRPAPPAEDWFGLSPSPTGSQSGDTGRAKPAAAPKKTKRKKQVNDLDSSFYGVPSPSAPLDDNPWNLPS